MALLTKEQNMKDVRIPVHLHVEGATGIVKLCLATHEVETTHALQGLGGCVAKSFKDVLSQGD